MTHRRKAISSLLLAIRLAVPVFLLGEAPELRQTGASEIIFASAAPEGLAHGGANLTLTGPDGFLRQATFAPGEEIRISVFDAEGDALVDGGYTFEIRLLPSGDKPLRSRLETSENEATISTGSFLGVFQNSSFGSFTIAGGALVLGDGEEELPVAHSAPAASHSGDGLTNTNAADVLYIDDVIVSANLCAGTGCVNGESFGQDVLRLKDVNNRIRFLDTSSSSFPSTDWQITANDSASGGANRFSIEDLSASTVPFTIAGGAPTNSLYVGNNGRVGFGTATPTDSLHVVTGDTPALQLQQDASSSFTPQTWRVAGNEAGFFVMDTTHGSILPFRIRPDAIENSIVIAADGNVGLGTVGPVSSLHVRREGVNVLVQDSTSTEAARVLMTLQNNGRVLLEMDDTSANGQNWRLRTVEGQFQIDTDGSSGNEFILTQAGNVTIQGMLTELSDRDAKTGIRAVEPDEVLAKVAQLPIATWSYKKDRGVEHLGPMAQDFHSLFGLGSSNQGISSYDAAGAALASVQALHRTVRAQEERMQEKEAEIEQLQQQNAELLRRLEALERARSSIQ